MKVYTIMNTDICFASKEEAKKYVDECFTLNLDVYISYEDIKVYNLITLEEAMGWLKILRLKD